MLTFFWLMFDIGKAFLFHLVIFFDGKVNIVRNNFEFNIIKVMPAQWEYQVGPCVGVTVGMLLIFLYLIKILDGLN
jgi:hypothetical protein